MLTQKHSKQIDALLQKRIDSIIRSYWAIMRRLIAIISVLIIVVISAPTTNALPLNRLMQAHCSEDNLPLLTIQQLLPANWQTCLLLSRNILQHGVATVSMWKWQLRT